MAAGLALAGMTDPRRVLGFLDFFGRWDPSLAFVMLGAVGTHAVLYRLILRRSAPILAPRFSVPTKRNVDRLLLLGSALFGVGWGLSGYCPGPVIVSLAAGGTTTLVFTVGLAAGMLACGFLHREVDATTLPRGAKT